MILHHKDFFIREIWHIKYSFRPKFTYSVIFITGTSSGNITLDSRFCDRSNHPNQINDCAQGLGFNTSLEIPISKHFSDPAIMLIFTSVDANVVMCPLVTDILSQCNEYSQEPDFPAVSRGPAPNTFEILVGNYQNIQVKFRMAKNLVRGPAQNVRNLCGQSDNKLGASFEEFNLRFYRTCSAWRVIHWSQLLFLYLWIKFTL